ncbi:putative sarcosine oxidase subunit gamma [Oceaniovalibus guishaninsula JLT2003]|uniref:Putative sarcosine oxidase subunit gamma n=1 Tax=Oceaniovalibus guishaninsula JLT2003 TaxID=1231392 RepID=K2HBI5_9RHOB|nr:sarcosine oxidase subunit gamma family protein [Oceaniovalibus guishaninsula]EKE44853.1 putative sarcosine oxidase subunit gamma [Oceaniovalibus guishaninsula JLT2003]
MTLHDRDLHGATVTIEEIPPVARFSLRVRDKDRAAAGAALGVDLPDRVGDRAASGDRTLVCLGPDEWLVTAPEQARDGIVRDMAAIRDGAPHSLTDISDREITFRVAGPAALTLMTIGCPRDLRRLEPGRAVRTVFDTAQIVLWRDGPDSFRLDVWRSFAPHVRSLLEIGRKEIAAGF